VCSKEVVGDEIVAWISMEVLELEFDNLAVFFQG
jgi:hypothetical protein